MILILANVLAAGLYSVTVFFVLNDHTGWAVAFFAAALLSTHTVSGKSKKEES